ncbi:MAG: hypothetical protein RRX94_07210 [Raoultibacter sp.]
MPTCVPISDMKDTAAFTRKVASAGEPVIVTKNGYETLIVMDAELFRHYRKETPQEQLERKLQESDFDLAAGNLHAMRAGLAAIGEKYGL